MVSSPKFILPIYSCLIALFLKHLNPTNSFSPIASTTSSLLSSSSSKAATKAASFQRTRVEVLANEIEIEASYGEDGDNQIQIQQPKQQLPESASLLPGQIVTIRIGDTSLARKAWKKRRRSGSPILVPCTITSINRELMIKYNILNLLHRFGQTSDNQKILEQRYNLVLSVGALVKLYKYRLGGDLLHHARALGHETIVAYLRSVFDEDFVRENGVDLVRIKHELVLASSLSLRLARESAYKATFVQFLDGHSIESSKSSDDDDDDDDVDNQPDINSMSHSGTTFQIANQKDKYQTIASMDPSIIQPLSAAVRIAHADEVSTRIVTGMELNAFVHSYEIEGDNGSPLLICAIDPPREQIREQIKRRDYVRKQLSTKNQNDLVKGFDNGQTIIDLKQLKTGEGPFKATVVNVSERSQAAFVDLGVSRNLGKKQGGGKARVLGMLRFEDFNVSHTTTAREELSSSEEVALIESCIQEGIDSDDLEEIIEEEDVSGLFSMDENGNIILIDPDSDSKTILGSIHDEIEGDDNDDDDDDDDNIFSGMSPEERLASIGDMLSGDDESEKPESAFVKVNDAGDRSIQVGDEIDVYVRVVSPQSGRFMVTTDNNVKKLKEVKKEREAEKRLERLSSKLGGEKGLDHILSYVGNEMEGEIKAKSKTGDWYYVQPICEDGLPVGIGPCANDIDEPLKAGDKVRVCIDGIDYTRGQLKLTIL